MSPRCLVEPAPEPDPVSADGDFETSGVMGGETRAASTSATRTTLRNSIALPWVLVVGVAAYIFADKSGYLGTWVYEPTHHEDESPKTNHGQIPDLHIVATPLSKQRLQQPATQAVDIDEIVARGLSSNSGGHGSNGGHGHKHDAMLFLFNAIVLGTFISHITTFPIFSGLQQSVVLFVFGVMLSCICNIPLDGEKKLHDKLGVFGRSYAMWMDIDPHLILFTMLPALLTGDAMTLDTSVARRVAKQCVYLASVGVLVSGMATAVFLWLYLPYDWSFLLSLTTGAILCATDPVAVVALLKELGASPRLTVQIQGESLLNDGTAIVLYMISYNMLKGQEYDFSEIIIFLTKTAFCAWIVGMVIGFVFFQWIRLASNKLEDHSSMIQVSLTICCAYWSFIIAEGVFHISGVLATVAAALVLAHTMWPVIVSKESMHTTWHMLEYLGNTVIFFLAGALTGQVMYKVPWEDYFHLLVIYVALTVIRFTMLFMSRPILRQLEEDKTPVSIGEVLVMTWGGLRGAVGLTLAIQVTIDRADGEISELNAYRVLFYVGGVAALTLIVNASTCPAVVNWLGITKLPMTKRRMLLLIHRRLTELAELDHEKDKEAHPVAVKKAITLMLDEMEAHIDADAPLKKKKKSQRVSDAFKDGMQLVFRIPQLPSGGGSMWRHSEHVSEDDSHNNRHSGVMHKIIHKFSMPDTHTLQPKADLLDAHAETKMKFSMIPPDQLELLGDLPTLNVVADQEQAMVDLVQNQDVDPLLITAINEAFLSLVRSRYEHQMEARDIIPGSPEAEVLLGSLTLALNHPHENLRDFSYIEPYVRRNQVGLVTPPTKGKGLFTCFTSDNEPDETSKKSCLRVHKMVESIVFKSAMVFMIFLYATIILVEEEVKGAKNEKNFTWKLAWLVMDAFFNVVFLFEMVLKLIYKRRKYFSCTWDLFDFGLIVLGCIGLIFNCLAFDKMGEPDYKRSWQGKLGGLSRAIRVLRIILLFRIVQFWTVLKRYFSKDEAILHIRKHMEKITILTCFVRGHVEASDEFIQFFGSHHKVDTAEVARCLLQSQVMVFRAISMAVSEEQQLDKDLLKEVNQVRGSKAVAEELERFVVDAHHRGIINTREAESILHPLHDHMKASMKKIQAMMQGVKKLSLRDEFDSEGDYVDAAGNAVAPPPRPGAPCRPSGSFGSFAAPSAAGSFISEAAASFNGVVSPMPNSKTCDIQPPTTTPVSLALDHQAGRTNAKPKAMQETDSMSPMVPPGLVLEPME